MQRFGRIALCGKPNVGKSTLFNRLLDAPLSVATPKPQTTRHNIRGMATCGAHQMVLVDTPGVAPRARRLARLLNATAQAGAGEVDAAALVVEALVWNARDAQVAQRLRALDLPVLLCINKIDRIGDRARLLPYLQRLADWGFAEYVPVSARTGEGCAALRALLERYLPAGAHQYGPKQRSDRSARFFAAERIREQLMVQLSAEVPYAAHVEIDSYRELRARVRIEAQILVERPSQRAILIGRGGAQLRDIGRAARLRLQRVLGRPVFLRLRVAVRDWQRDARIAQSYRGD